MEGRTRFYKGIGWGLFAGGCVLMAITAAMNWFQGDHIGVTQAGKWLNSIGSVTVDMVGIVCIGMAAGACWAIRRYAWAILFTFALLSSAGWSVNSILSYQATERISAAKTRDTNNKRIDKADKIAEDHIKWTRGTSVTGDLGKSERKVYLDAASSEIDKFRKTKVEARLEPDAGAQVIANVTGYNLETVQIGQSTYFAILLIFLKSLCFPGAGYFLNPLAFAATEQKKTHPASGGSSGSSGRPKLVQPAEPKQAVQGLRTEPARTMHHQLEPAPKARSAGHVFLSTDAPKGKLTYDQFVDVIRQDMAHGEPASSTRALAHMTGWSQSSASRQQRRLREKADRIVRRYPGYGGAHHVSAGA